MKFIDFIHWIGKHFYWFNFCFVHTQIFFLFHSLLLHPFIVVPVFVTFLCVCVYMWAYVWVCVCLCIVDWKKNEKIRFFSIWQRRWVCKECFSSVWCNIFITLVCVRDVWFYTYQTYRMCTLSKQFCSIHFSVVLYAFIVFCVFFLLFHSFYPLSLSFKTILLMMLLPFWQGTYVCLNVYFYSINSDVCISKRFNNNKECL